MRIKSIAKLLNCFIAKTEKNNSTMKQCNNSKSSQGFTLIELLVVVVVAGILTSIATASFFEYYRTQILQAATNDLRGTLNVAKSNSLSQLKCASSTLDGYKVRINDSTTYTLYVVCSGTDVPMNTKTLPQNITFISPTPATFFFAVLTGRVVFTVGGFEFLGPQTIILRGYGKTRNITVSNTGVIQ